MLGGGAKVFCEKLIQTARISVQKFFELASQL